MKYSFSLPLLFSTFFLSLIINIYLENNSWISFKWARRPLISMWYKIRAHRIITKDLFWSGGFANYWQYDLKCRINCLQCSYCVCFGPSREIMSFGQWGKKTLMHVSARNFNKDFYMNRKRSSNVWMVESLYFHYPCNDSIDIVRRCNDFLVRKLNNK